MLAHIINEETFNKLVKDIQDEYTLEKGEYYLQTSGLVPKKRHDEFRDNNIKLNESITELQKNNVTLENSLKVFGGISETEFKTLKDKSEASFSTEEKEKLVLTEVEKRIVKLKEENEKVVNDLTIKNNSLNSNLSKVLIDTNLKSIGIKLKVRPEAVQDFVTRGSQVFKLVDGKPTPVTVGEDGKEEILYGKDGQTALDMGDWAAELSKSAPHLFEKSTGGGTRHQSTTTTGGADSGLIGIGKMQAARNA